MKKKWIAGALALVLTATTVFAAAPVTASAAGNGESGRGTGTTYYVSSVDGDDSNNGMSEDQAFETLDKINEITLGPGDEVVFLFGSFFEDLALHIKGSGWVVAPLIVSTL